MKILVIGATGQQGKYAVKALLAKGHEVTGFSRKGNAAEERLKSWGATMAYGNLFDPASLVQAMRGMDGVVFIPVITTAADPGPEVTVGENVVRAAEQAGVKYLLHTSVNRAGAALSTYENWHGRYSEGYQNYWIAKTKVIDRVKDSKVPAWTILKPVFLMDCFVPPKVYGMFMQLREGRLASGIEPGKELQLMAADDQAELIAEVFDHFDDYAGKELELASDSLTMGEIAETISAVTGKVVRSVYKAPEEIAKDEELGRAITEAFKDYPDMDISGVLDAMAGGYRWDNEVGYDADIEKAGTYGVRLSTFREWAERHKADFDIV